MRLGVVVSQDQMVDEDACYDIAGGKEVFPE